MTDIRSRLLFLTALVALPPCYLVVWSPAHPAEPGVDYARDVRPIFARACVGCHGPEKQRGGLRLDLAAGLREGGDSGPPVVPGDSSRSRLYRAITGGEDAVPMPPKDQQTRLTAEEVGR